MSVSWPIFGRSAIHAARCNTNALAPCYNGLNPAAEQRTGRLGEHLECPLASGVFFRPVRVGLAVFSTSSPTELGQVLAQPIPPTKAEKSVGLFVVPRTWRI